MAYLPKVSVIVPIYNEEATLNECIRSLIGLEYPKEQLELIFVNNASTDRTEEILNCYKDEIRILDEVRRGAAAARNKGIHHANGVIIAFTDADCIVDRNWLKNIVRPLQEGGVGIVGGRNLSVRPCNKVEEFGEKIHDHESAITRFNCLPYAITMNWASRVSVLKEVGLFDERFMRNHDVDLSRRIFKKGYDIVYEDEAIVYHHNERTFLGLFRQGYVHGFWAVNTRKLHSGTLLRSDHHRINMNSYRKIFANYINSIIGQNRIESICNATFNLGKKVGMIAGSIRFLHMDL
jgi:cellulose synthase/poly-beta-1,6-N-acetylglucosamine synthase-like glycosyltransferase